MKPDNNSYFENLYYKMDVDQLIRLSKLSNEDGKSRIKIELRKREAIVAINDLLKKFDFEITDLYSELKDPKIIEIIEDKYERPIKRRKESIPRYRLNGKNYDGRQARRAKEFSEFVKSGRVDVNLVVKRGAFNPKWFNKQDDRVLFTLGITDKKAYKLKHDL